MLKATNAVALAAAMMGVVTVYSVAAHAAEADGATLAPGRGISLQIGGKHAVGYFQTKDSACHLTVVVADATGGETGLDSPGTRFVVPVLPGKGFQIDAGAGRSAEFLCGPDAETMNARVFDRAPYKS